MRILITGANGLVGKNIVNSPLFSQYEIFSPSSKEVNLLHWNKTNEYLRDIRPELVIHCAGKVGGIHANMNDPLGFFYENLEMGKNILMSAYENEVSKVINFGSSCIYPKDVDGLLSENMILKGELEPTNEGYALAKLSVLKLGTYLNHKKNENFVKTIIPCNLYGEHDNFNEFSSHLIPSIIRKIDYAIESNSSEVEIWGTGKARREFMYIQDLVNFVKVMIERFSEAPDCLNVGIGADLTVNEYYETIAKELKFTGTFTHNLDKPEGMKRKVVDISRAKELGWGSQFSLDEGIRKTYEYYLRFKQGNIND